MTTLGRAPAEPLAEPMKWAVRTTDVGRSEAYARSLGWAVTNTQSGRNEYWSYNSDPVWILWLR